MLTQSLSYELQYCKSPLQKNLIFQLFLYSLKLQKSEGKRKLLQFVFLIYLPPSSAQAKAAKKAITTNNSFIPVFTGEEFSRRQGKLITCNLVFLNNCNLNWLRNLFKYASIQFKNQFKIVERYLFCLQNFNNRRKEELFYLDYLIFITRSASF